ncbi:MAG: hypothetical protein MUE46_13645 [Xanthomonadales bacterium]|jgi:hypothetical protein|nr:hypothetical protein [Xanthomonadales bacterium]
MRIACGDWSAVIKFSERFLKSAYAYGIIFSIILVFSFYLRGLSQSIDNNDSDTFACLVSVGDIKIVEVYNPNDVPSVEVVFRILRSADSFGKWHTDGRVFKLYYTIGNAREGLYYSVVSVDDFGPFVYPVVQANSSGGWWDGERKEWNADAPSADLILSRWRWHVSR